MDDQERSAQERREADRERIRQEMEAEKRRLEEWLHARKGQEINFQKPEYADALNSAALRNAEERDQMRKAQAKAMEDALKTANKYDGEEREAAREEIRKALEHKFREQRLRMEQEQIERADRLALLYDQVKYRER